MKLLRSLAATAVVSGIAFTAATAQDKPTVAFIPGIASDPFFKAMEIGARAKAEELGIELIWQGSASEYSPQTQLPFVDAALAQGVDALILVPTDPDSLQASVARAEAMNIPVITPAVTAMRRGPDIAKIGCVELSPVVELSSTLVRPQTIF